MQAAALDLRGRLSRERDQRGVPRDRGLGGRRRLLRAVGSGVGDRAGRPLLLPGDPRGPVPPLELDRPDRVRLLAGLPPARLAADRAAVAGVHGRLDGDPHRGGLVPVRAAVLRPRPAHRGDGDRRRQHPPARDGGDRRRLPLPGRLGVRAADQDLARRRPAVVRGPAGVALPGDRPGLRPPRSSPSRSCSCPPPGASGSTCSRTSPAATGRGRPCRSRSSSACRSPSRSSSGAPGRIGSGSCRSPR